VKDEGKGAEEQIEAAEAEAYEDGERQDDG